MIKSKYKFDTLQIHAGSRPDPSTGARQVPIYQNTAYVFKSILHAEALFDLKELGHIYSRLSNPTVSVLQERIRNFRRRYWRCMFIIRDMLHNY